MRTELNLEMASKMKDFTNYLRQEERSMNTISKYIRDLNLFFSYLGEKKIDKTIMLEWKESLSITHAPTSINSMLAAVNKFLEWDGLGTCKVKPLKIQKQIFVKPEKELTREEYLRLVKTAEKESNKRLALIIQTICATGIRVSELKFITAEAVKTGRAMVNCKGKTRVVFLPKDLCQLLKHYCREQRIERDMIFRTKTGKAIDRTNIWRDMKSLCRGAGVKPEKVFPHNLRHLFARSYYQLDRDLVRLADLLGHSSLSTTRIYTMESGAEHLRGIERLGLILARP